MIIALSGQKGLGRCFEKNILVTECAADTDISRKVKSD